jgi:hypothetical protein
MGSKGCFDTISKHFEDTKGKIRSRISKDRQYNEQRRTGNDIQHTTYTPLPLKKHTKSGWMTSGTPEWFGSF